MCESEAEMFEQPLIAQSEIETLQAQGYRVENLNENRHGLEVRGPNWKVFAPDGSSIGYKWLAVDAWVLARDHAAYTSPAPPS